MSVSQIDGDPKIIQSLQHEPNLQIPQKISQSIPSTNQKQVKQQNVAPQEESNVQFTDQSRDKLLDSDFKDGNLLNQQQLDNGNNPHQASTKSKRSAQGSLNGEEPNDIDDDLIFSQNTIEVGDQIQAGEKELTDYPSTQQQSKNEDYPQNSLDDSLEKNIDFMHKTTSNKYQENNNNILLQSETLQKDQSLIVIENQQGYESNIKDFYNDKLEKMKNDPQIIKNLVGSLNYNDNQFQSNLDSQKIAHHLSTGESVKMEDFEQEAQKEFSKQEKQQKTEKPEQIQINEKQITFQADSDVNEQEEHEQVKRQQHNFNKEKQLNGNQDLNNLRVVTEESDVQQNQKGSIIPPQHNVDLQLKDQLEQQAEKKPFDYQKLEGYLKNQKRNLVYPSQNITQEEQSNYNHMNNQNPIFVEQENQAGDSSPLLNKGNASRTATGFDINSQNFKFTVKPIVNSSQFFNQESKQNIQEYGQGNQPNIKNKKVNISGVRQQGINDQQQSKQGSESLEVSEVYQSNFYQEGAQSGRNISEQTFVSISNSSQPTQFVNKLSNVRNNDFNSQEEIQNRNQPPSQKYMKRFTNLRESINDEQDIPEELSAYSKNTNTVQRYMAEQVNIMGSGSVKDAKRQSTASMMTVESKDMEGATQDQVRKIVAEQVENMIKSKLQGHSANKQNNMIINNEDHFRQVIREELQNFLRNNTNLVNPASMPHLSSPTSSNVNSRSMDRRNNKMQLDKFPTDKKQSTASASLRDQTEITSQKGIQSGQQTPHYLNNEDIEDIIDESIQKHQFAQIQNRLAPQNEQFLKQQQQPRQIQQSSPQHQILNHPNERNIYQEPMTRQEEIKSGDYPISITSNNNNKAESNYQKQLQGADAQSLNQQSIHNKSQNYKDQYKMFKNALQNDQNQSMNNNLQNYTQNYQVNERQQKQNPHQTSYISSENSPQFARDRDSLRLGEISFSINKQQSNQLNKQLLSNDSHQSTSYNQFHTHQSQSKNSLFQQQQNRNIQSKQSDYSIQSFAPPLPPSRQGRNYQDNQNIQSNQDTQRDTLPDVGHSTSIQSPTSFFGQEQKINYQEYIAHPPKRHLYTSSEYENENLNVHNQNNMMESSIIQRNSEQHHSLESIQNQVFQNQSGGYGGNPYSSKIQLQQKRQQEVQNQQSITQLWEKALDFQQRGQLSRAYQMLLDIEDDIYLIRMMSRTGPCFSKLNQNVGKKLLRRINKITQSQFMDNISLQLFQKAYEQDLLEDLNLEDNQIIKEMLYDISASVHLGEQAARLYNLIDRSEHN